MMFFDPGQVYCFNPYYIGYFIYIRYLDIGSQHLLECFNPYYIGYFIYIRNFNKLIANTKVYSFFTRIIFL